MLSRRARGTGRNDKVSQDIASLADAAISCRLRTRFPCPERVPEPHSKVKTRPWVWRFLVPRARCRGCVRGRVSTPWSSVWDVAALQVIVEEAGGSSPISPGQADLDGGSAISSNGLVHEEVLAFLSGRERTSTVSGTDLAGRELHAPGAQLARAAGEAVRSR